MSCKDFFKRNGMGFRGPGESTAHPYTQTWSISWQGGPFKECVESKKIKGAKDCGGKLFSHNLDLVADKNMNTHKLSWRTISNKRVCSNMGDGIYSEAMIVIQKNVANNAIKNILIQKKRLVKNYKVYKASKVEF